MSKKCDLTGKQAQFGNNVSHSQRKTRRRFNPNVHDVTVRSDVLKRTFKMRLASSTLRSIDHNGGFDNFLVTAKANNLTEDGQKIRRLVKKQQAAQ